MDAHTQIYLEAVTQCYAKAAEHIEKEVLPSVTDAQTRQGLEFLVEHGKKTVADIKSAAKLAGNLASE